MLQLGKFMIFFGTLVFFFVAKLSSIRAERLFPYDCEKQEKKNHSLRYAVLGIVLMFVYLGIAYIYPLLPHTNVAFDLRDIPLTCFGISITLLILDLLERNKSLKSFFVSFAFSLIFLFIIKKII